MIAKQTQKTPTLESDAENPHTLALKRWGNRAVQTLTASARDAEIDSRERSPSPSLPTAVAGRPRVGSDRCGRNLLDCQGPGKHLHFKTDEGRFYVSAHGAGFSGIFLFDRRPR